MKQSTSAFSLVLALGLVLLLSFIALYVLEYMIPYSRNVQGIEHASQSMYETLSGVEESLYKVGAGDLGDEFTKVSAGLVDYSYSMNANAARIPELGLGKSTFNNDKNIVSQNQGIELNIGKGRFSSASENFEVFLNVPDFDMGASIDTDILDETGDNELILWQISARDDTLSAERNTLLRASDINSGNTLDLWSEFGTTLVGNTTSVSNFYTTHCSNTSSECVLNISIIRDLEADSSERIFPFLEYYIESSALIPTGFVNIEASGTSYGFYKNIDFSVLKQDSNSAFDFTIFQ